MVNYMGPGGGMAIPPYLQGRAPMITPKQPGMPTMGMSASSSATRPMITPKASVVPGETKSPGNFLNMFGKMQGATKNLGHNPIGLLKGLTPNKAVQPPNWNPITPGQQQFAPGTTMGAGNNPTSPISPAGQSAYDVLKGDLEDNRRSAMSGAVSDASARGVYYGSPLTTSQGDIQTQYLRGLGQLQAGVLGNEQQNELSRLQIASGLLGQSGVAQGGKIDPAVMQMLGTLYGGSQAAQGAGPSIAPYRYTQLPQPTQQQPKLRGITPRPM